MKRDEIEKRVADLEAEKARRNSGVQDQAFDRLWSALDVGLCPGSPPMPFGRIGRCEKPLLALDDRLTAGTDTDTDRAVLASLPADALAVWIAGGISPRDFVAVFAKILRMC